VVIWVVASPKDSVQMLASIILKEYHCGMRQQYMLLILM